MRNRGANISPLAEDAGAQKAAGEEPQAKPTEQEDHSTPLCEGLVTLSTLPKSRWHNLSQLEVIKVTSA